MTCRRDLELTKLQLKSISAFLRSDVANSITVIINDKDASAVKGEIRWIISRLPFAAPVRILAYDEIVPAGATAGCTSLRTQTRDWYSAQVARMYIARKLSAEYQVILTSKDIFVNPARIEEFFYNGKANIPALVPDLCDRLTYHHWLASCEIFGVNPIECSPAHAASPFVVNNHQMCQMIDYVDSLGKPLATRFYESIESPNGGLSYRPVFDLFLYAAWLHKTDLFYQLHNPGEICASQCGKSENIGNPSITQVSPRLLQGNADDQTWVDSIRAVLVDRTGLINDTEFTQLVESFK